MKGELRGCSDCSLGTASPIMFNYTIDTSIDKQPGPSHVAWILKKGYLSSCDRCTSDPSKGCHAHRAQAHMPAELMMHIASCLGSDADRQTLRMLNRQWKAAVDDSVSR